MQAYIMFGWMQVYIMSGCLLAGLILVAALRISPLLRKIVFFLWRD